MISKLVGAILRPYWRLTRGMTLGAQGVVLDAENRVLLVRHSYRPGWHFPGGGVEPGETIDSALARELEEEAGVLIDRAPELHGVFANFAAFPRDHIAVYIVRAWRRPDVPPPNAEIVESGWFGIENLPEATSDGARRRMAEIFKAEPVQADW